MDSGQPGPTNWEQRDLGISPSSLNPHWCPNVNHLLPLPFPFLGHKSSLGLLQMDLGAC